MSTLVILYALGTLILAVYGFRGLVLSGTLVWLQWIKPKLMRPERAAPAAAALPASSQAPSAWPTITIQLPIYNERYVVERVIDAAAALQYPVDRLHIQVLDDSTDDTVAIARARVAHYKARGVNIDYVQRPDRQGYKAGALAYGLTRTTAEFVGIFDADFMPPPDFLQRVMPHFDHEGIGMVQTRWGHLNAGHSLLTRAQALFLDAHFGVEQPVRNATGLLLNFNGSAGVWRRACIDDAGGWEADTLAEDLDLSFRAQLRGWQMHYLRDVVAPAEMPTLLAALKRQQFRWAKGSIQCLMKNGGRLVNSTESLMRKIEGLLHLTGYIAHPLMMVVAVLSLPLVITGEINRAHLGAIGLAGFGAPVMFVISQIALYPKDWFKRCLFLPTIVFLGPGLALSNTAGILEALLGRNPGLFLRTPKLPTQGSAKTASSKESLVYSLPIDWTTWAEIFFMCYTALTTAFALQHAPALAPLTASYAVGFGYTAWLGIKQALDLNAKPMQHAITMD